MRLIDHNSVLSAFAEHVEEASAIDIAVAWVTPGRHLEILRNAARSRGIKVRVVVGLAGNSTAPVALRSIMDFGGLRIADDGERLFHPKFYLFHKASGVTAWIGSANFTGGGFARNAELLAEVEGGEEAHRWFTRLWEALPVDPRAAVAEYEERYEPPSRPSGSGKADSTEGGEPNHPIDLLVPMPKSWSAYMTALRSADRWWCAQGNHWNVLGPFRSYVHTISSAAEVMHRTNWDDLTLDDVDILLSTRGERNGAYGLLGHVGMIGLVKQAFRRNTEKDLHIRESCRAALAKAAISEGEEFYAAVHDALTTITSFERFGPAVATRLLTLACPARAVSVNNASAEGLGQLFELPGTVRNLGSPDIYVNLLRRIHSTAWYSAPMPSDGFEQEIWSMRTALLDAFVYQAE